MTKTVSTKEAVEISGKSATAIRKAITDKKVKATKKGNGWDINRASLEKWAGVKDAPKPKAEKPEVKKTKEEQAIAPEVSEVDALKNEIDDLKKENLDLIVRIKELTEKQCKCGCPCNGNCDNSCKSPCGKKCGDCDCKKSKTKASIFSFFFPKS